MYSLDVVTVSNFCCVQARKAIALRSTMEKKLSNIEREKKEDNLRQLAHKARDARVGLRAPEAEGENTLTCLVYVNNTCHGHLSPPPLQRRLVKSKRETNCVTRGTRRERDRGGLLRLILINGQKWTETRTEM